MSAKNIASKQDAPSFCLRSELESIIYLFWKEEDLNLGPLYLVDDKNHYANFQDSSILNKEGKALPEWFSLEEAIKIAKSQAVRVETF
jgi:hypothetical protein